jgi:hypothetical protein
MFAKGISDNKEIFVEMQEAVGSFFFKVSLLRIFKDNVF